MNRVELTKKYVAVGASDCNIASIDQLMPLFNLSMRKIDGVSQFAFTQWNEVIKTFIIRFYNAWTMEMRENIEPIRFEKCEDETQIEFVYKIKNRVLVERIDKLANWY
jgi:hypothetical protein